MKMHTLSLNTSIKEVIQYFINFNIAIALITDTDKKLLGVITQGDVIRFLNEYGNDYGKAEDIMTINFIYLNVSNLDKKDEMHLKHEIPHIPILQNNGKLYGLSSVYKKEIIYE